MYYYYTLYKYFYANTAIIPFIYTYLDSYCREENLRIVVNEKVKEREWWRPLAPSVLAEEAQIWFDLASSNGSPYMSLTCDVREEYRTKVPAICHIDGSARLQTVTKNENPLYHSLISAFYSKTKVPMILNTSFNRKSQPIVETPTQAISTLLASKGSIEFLFMGRLQIRCKEFPLTSQLTEEQKEAPIFALPLYLTEITSSTQQSDSILRVRVQDGRTTDEWVEFPSLMHLEILQSLQSSMGVDGVDEYNDTTVGDIYEAFSSVDEDSEESIYDWPDVVEVLRWLYLHNYVYFDSSLVELDPSDAFKGMELIDLR